MYPGIRRDLCQDASYLTFAGQASKRGKTRPKRIRARFAFQSKIAERTIVKAETNARAGPDDHAGAYGIIARKFMNMVATSARVAVPRGSNMPSPFPFNIWAAYMASTASFAQALI